MLPSRAHSPSLAFLCFLSPLSLVHILPARLIDRERTRVVPRLGGWGKRGQKGGFLQGGPSTTIRLLRRQRWTDFLYVTAALQQWRRAAPRRSAPDRVVARVHLASRVRPWACSGCSGPPTPCEGTGEPRSRTPGEVDDASGRESQPDATRVERSVFTIFTDRRAAM